MRKHLLIGLCVYVASSAGYAQAPATAPERPRLVLVLSIDQMRSDFLDRFAPLYAGGLRQLIDRGGVFTRANYRHAATDTGELP